MKSLLTIKENKKNKEKEKIKEITRRKKDRNKNLIGMRITKKDKRLISKNKMLQLSRNRLLLIVIKKIKYKRLSNLKVEKLEKTRYKNKRISK
jgi:hypothetical protein